MKIKNYSKPILSTDNNSAYKDDYSFSINVVETKFIDENVSLNINFNLTSDLLKNLLNDKAALFIKWKSDFNAGCLRINNINENFALIISKEKLERTDTLYITAFITSIGNIILENNGEWIERYESSDRFNYHDSELLAESNTERIDYKSTGEPFVHIMTDPNGDGKGITFNATLQNHIAINVGPNLKEAYTKLNIKSKKVYAGKIIDSFLVFNAIVYSIIYMVQQENLDSYKEKEWFKCVDHCFDEANYESLEDYINAMKEDIDIASIYKVAQNMLHNAIEYNLVESLRTLQWI